MEARPPGKKQFEARLIQLLRRRFEEAKLKEAITDLYEKEVIELMALLNIREESIPKYIDALGREKVLAALSKEERLAGLSKEERLAGLSKEEIVATLSEDDLLTVLQKNRHLLKSLFAKMRQEELPEKARRG